MIHLRRGNSIVLAGIQALVACAIFAAATSTQAAVNPGISFDGAADVVGLVDSALALDEASPIGGGEITIPFDRIRWHVADPEDEFNSYEKHYQQALAGNDKAEAARRTRIHDRVGEIRRPQQRHLSLQEAIRTTLDHNFAIQVASYEPAVDTTRVVEAEAAFDATFFTNVTKNIIDRPTGLQIASIDSDLLTSSYGIRKILPTGMSVSGSYELDRTKTSPEALRTLNFTGYNPQYFSRFVFDMRQPFLRGFGIDFNRSIIMLAKNNQKVSQHAFERQVRDTLRQVEEAYWRLVQARRDIVITARLLADFEAIYEYLLARQQFDITPVQLDATRANLEQSKADFVARRAAVFNAEDRLIALMNGGKLDLGANTEIIPDDFPELHRLVVDRLGEVQVALENRPEIKEQKIRVASAKIVVDRAKNGELPQFDLIFRTTSDGLGSNADRSFDELSRGNFLEYIVGVEFSAPIGNRAARAVSHRSRLQYSQAIAALKQTFEEVILDVNVATRTLNTDYDVISPAYEAAEAREREVNSIVARAERKDINTLTTELNSRQSLAGARRAMIGAMVEYTIAIADLERAKGTLLQFNNIIIPPEKE
ncbi:MAG: TolC family protein [Planctomycetes bacterium]|nr:TolC family protein [Planctomycetota bacterium]MBI3833578.1 TolC family protein [Planctomycetota bacterium]